MIYNNEIKKQRGWVMRILDRIYPDGLDQNTIKKQLIDLQFTPSEFDIRGIIAYLEDKENGYIKSQKVGSHGFERTIIMLTAKGKDLLEGNEPPDPGVDIGE
ncbi:hypothetical protein [Anaerosolibacter sp.]|uniref:hypothetical protein n=1 Tax=Anaerosolibacter sp. TaxID=1872527 RepID=UPI0039F063F6